MTSMLFKAIYIYKVYPVCKKLLGFHMYAFKYIVYNTTEYYLHMNQLLLLRIAVSYFFHLWEKEKKKKFTF